MKRKRKKRTTKLPRYNSPRQCEAAKMNFAKYRMKGTLAALQVTMNLKSLPRSVTDELAFAFEHVSDALDWWPTELGDIC